MLWSADNLAYVLLIVGVLLAAGVVASKASTKLGLPALLLFLGVGMAAGSEGPGNIPFDDPELAQAVGVVALTFILFAGGLDTRWRLIRPVLVPGAALATFGVIVTAGIVGAGAYVLLDLPLQTAMLLGAIVSSTDAAAVFGVLRSRNLHLGGRVRGLLELESGSNDPMAVFLTVALISLHGDASAGGLVLAGEFVLNLVVGLVGGLAAGRAMVWVINRLHLEYDGLYLVLMLAAVLLTYSAVTLLEGSGFLAVYIMGLHLGRLDFIHKGSLTRFHDGLAWLMQIAMFLTLGLLVFPSELGAVAVESVIIALVLMFVGRPLAVVLVWPFMKMNKREVAFIGWVGLKGAVPIVLATFPLLAGVERADLLFNVVFFVVLLSVVVQGATIPLAARWLRLISPEVEQPLDWSHATLNSKTARSRQIVVPSASPSAGKQIVDLPLPTTAMVLTLFRDGRASIPSGATVLHADDRLLVLAEEDVWPTVEEVILGRPRTGS